MVFDSLSFVVFFALVLLIHYALTSWHARKVHLVIASYLFYGAWNPLYLLLLFFSTLLSWALARKMLATTYPHARFALLLISVSASLGVLFYYKYANFLLETLNAVLLFYGTAYAPPKLDLVLPIGISFYTFQTLSYTLDVYRKQLTESYSLLDFCLYIAFFPQLVAGPIVRADVLLPQFKAPKAFDADEFYWGLSLISFGLFTKIVLADAIFAPAANAVYAHLNQIGTLEAWIGIFAFSGQIFCDFSGYSTCAIGAALCLGFYLPRNFWSPYAAIGFSDFWRRWHISLSSWIRDYLYIALGGNRGGWLRVFFNLMLTMLLSGLWHGASWLFVLWGGVHGVYLVAEHLLKKLFQHRPIRWSSLGLLGLALLTFWITTLTWVLFRAPTLAAAGQLFQVLFSPQMGNNFVIDEPLLVMVTLVALFIVQWLTRTVPAEVRIAQWTWPLRALLLFLAWFAILFVTKGDDRVFIYFQF